MSQIIDGQNLIIRVTEAGAEAHSLSLRAGCDYRAHAVVKNGSFLGAKLDPDGHGDILLTHGPSIAHEPEFELLSPAPAQYAPTSRDCGECGGSGEDAFGGRCDATGCHSGQVPN